MRSTPITLAPTIMAAPNQAPTLGIDPGLQHAEPAGQYGSAWASHDPPPVRPLNNPHQEMPRQPSWGEGALDQQLWYDQSGLAWAGPPPYSPFQPQPAPHSPETVLSPHSGDGTECGDQQAVCSRPAPGILLVLKIVNKNEIYYSSQLSLHFSISIQPLVIN